MESKTSQNMEVVEENVDIVSIYAIPVIFSFYLIIYNVNLHRCLVSLFVYFQDWGNERLMRAQRAVEANLYDVDSWSLLIREAQNRSINDVRSMYEKLIIAFPTTGRYWKIYIEQEVTIFLLVLLYTSATLD